MEQLEGWLLTYNPHIGSWLAVTRDNANLLFNDHKNSEVLKSKSSDTIIELIIKTQGKQDKINTLLRNNK